MKHITISILALLIPIFCIAQTDQDYIIIGELRLSDGKRIVPFKEFYHAKFYQKINSDSLMVDGISAELVEKEEYYDPEITKGTEIRFYIPKKLLENTKEVKLKGELFSKLKSEVIRCEFIEEIVIKLKDRNRIGVNTYKLDTGINLRDPAKFTLTSEVLYLNQLLYNEILTGSKYSKEVDEILNFEPKDETLSKTFLKKCHEIYTHIEPHFIENGYFLFEENELDSHIEQVNQDLNIYRIGTYSGNESLESLKRDSLESILVAKEYKALKGRLAVLKEKLDYILFDIPNGMTKPIKGNQNNVQFNIVTAVSSGKGATCFNKHFVNADGIIENRENKYSSSIVGMTNFFLMKKGNRIRPYLSLGIGANFQGSKIDLGGFFGAGLSFGKNNIIGIDFGVSRLAIKELNPTFEVGQKIPEDLEVKEVIRNDYRWAPFVSVSIPFKWIFQQFSSPKDTSRN